MSQAVPLAECEAVIRECDWHQHADQIDGVLWFTWNGHRHVIPYSQTGEDAVFTDADGKAIGKSLVWKHISGSTIDDLTLAPSYFAKAPEYARLHCFIREGKVWPV